MRKAALSLFAAFVLTLSFAVAPASANESAIGERFAISLNEMPDSAVAGNTVTGTFTINLLDSIRAVRKTVSYTVTAETPLGEGTLRSGSFTMVSGNPRTVELSFPIAPNTRPGVYVIEVSVTVDNETLVVSHAITISGNR
jgi:hypothetical protein